MHPFTFFISDRRQDTAPIALLLKNDIEKRMQFVRVSVDVEAMQPGDEFPARLRGLIDGAHATIALIGRQWPAQRAERIDNAGWPSAIGPLIDRMAVRLALKKRPDGDEDPKPDLAKARTQPLPDSELAQILRSDDFAGWNIDNHGNAPARCLA